MILCWWFNVGDARDCDDRLDMDDSGHWNHDLNEDEDWDRDEFRDDHDDDG